MKFVKHTEIKEGYLYERRDLESSTIVLCVYKKIGHFVYIKYPNDNIITFNTISDVPETHKNFNDNDDYAYYEIGKKEDYPEYFL